jgi:hypothetical protein
MRGLYSSIESLERCCQKLIPEQKIIEANE